MRAWICNWIKALFCLTNINDFFRLSCSSDCVIGSNSKEKSELMQLNQNWLTNPKPTCDNYDIYVNYQIPKYCLPDYALSCHVAGAFFSCFTAAAKWSLLDNQCWGVKLGLSFSHHVALAVCNPILSAIDQSQSLRCSFSAVPLEVLTSCTALNNLVFSSLEVRGAVSTWERTWPSVIIMRPTLYPKNQTPFRVELAIRAKAGFREFDDKPSSRKAGPHAELCMASQPNRILLLSSGLWEVFRKYFVMEHHPLASQPSLSSSLAAYTQEQGCLVFHKVKDTFWMTSEWFILTLNAAAARLLLQYDFLYCS